MRTFPLPCLWLPSHDEAAPYRREGGQEHATRNEQTGDAPRARSVAGNVIRGSLGNLIEWYDWYAYAAFSIYFASVFFPSGNPTAQLLNTAGIFAVGFLIRPLGGWLFGWYADRFGRRAALTLSVTMMGVGSLGIAVLPGYAQIGALAPILLVAAAAAAGVVARRRVRNLRNVSERSRHATPARLLLLIPVRDVDQRPTARAGCADHPAAGAHRRSRCMPGAGGSRSSSERRPP